MDHGKTAGAWISGPNLFGMAAAKAAYDKRGGAGWKRRNITWKKIPGSFPIILGTHAGNQRHTAHEGTYLMWLDFKLSGPGRAAIAARWWRNAESGGETAFHLRGREEDLSD